MKSLFACGVLSGLVIAAAAYADIQVNATAGAGSGTGTAASANLGGDSAASTPATDTTAAATDTAPATNRCEASCYDTPDAKAGCTKITLGKGCQAFEQNNPGFFSQTDAQCGFQAGTTRALANLESAGTCSMTIRPSKGSKYQGLFQYAADSCGGNLQSAQGQATCLCSDSAKFRQKYTAATGGQTPSAGLYYLYHQQRNCALPLATSGNKSAVATVADCVRGSKSFCRWYTKTEGPCESAVQSYARKAIAGNLSCNKSYSAATVTAQQFSDCWASRFSSIEGAVCGDGSTASLDDLTKSIQTAAAGNPSLAEILANVGGAGNLANALAASGFMNASGNPISLEFALKVLTAKTLSELFGEDNDYNTLYGPDDEDEADDDTRLTVTVTVHDDGTKTVTVTKGDTTKTYEIALGYKLWKCDGTFSRVATGSSKDKAMKADSSCTLVTEGTEEDAK